MAISTGLYISELNEFLETIRQYPESAEQEKLNFLSKITKTEHSKRISIVATILAKIYDHDYKALRRDMHKVMVLNAERVTDQQERIIFLMCIKGTVDFYMKGDYSELFQYLDDMCIDEEDFDYASLPYT